LQKLSSLGITGNALEWFQSYLNNRYQSIRINETLSDFQLVTKGVPQGSVLGPVLFSLYLTGIEEVMQKHDIQYVIFADDIQLITTTPPAQIQSSIRKLEECINELSQWLVTHSLALNNAKTEFLILGTSPQLKKCDEGISLIVGGVTIHPNRSSVRDLGVLLDPKLTMSDHVTACCRRAYAYLKSITRQKQALPVAKRLMLVKALVLPQLDYGAALLYNIDKKVMNRMTRVIRSSIRMACGLRKYDSVSNELRDKGILSMENRITLRILLIVRTVIETNLPEYLRELLEWYQPGRALRSLDSQQLSQSRVRTKAGARAFQIVAAAVWNEIPQHVRDLKTQFAFRKAVYEILLKRENLM
jgi:hypothetical protein